MRIMITGAKGQLGSDCAQVLGENHEIGVSDYEEMDITSTRAVNDALASFGPDVVVNCAAYTAVDRCETEREAAWKVNVVGPRNLASSVNRYGGRLVHISTDYVFDGKKQVPAPYAEEDELGPLNYYGETKMEGEKAVALVLDRFIILRTSWLYGVSGSNFLKTMLKLALKDPKQEIKVVNDQYGGPTWTYGLAQQIESLLDTDNAGIFHASDEGHCTWYELAGRFLEKMAVPHTVVPCTSEEYPTPALRPRNSILENGRLKEKGINRMAHWQNDLDRFVACFHERLMDEAMPAGNRL